MRFIPACAGSRRPIPNKINVQSVHPRVRGEQTKPWPEEFLLNGSSPRARGAAGKGSPNCPGCRFIPACAGSRHGPRGERGVLSGSSPRARGADLGTQFFIAVKRFIPACAGSRTPDTDMTFLQPVHPRVRGEQVIRVPIGRMGPGSSPRARGAGQHWPRAAFQIRFIPACAGSRRRFVSINEHPGGSSPRARGAGEPFAQQRPKWRFIPACAGSRSMIQPSLSRSSVHPRVRGEQTEIRACIKNNGGSSPRARGAGVMIRGCDIRHRFIPACAGSRTKPLTKITGTTVHPRVRGEQAKVDTITAHINGSSPRARGAGIRNAVRVLECRFIPACAGSRISPVGSSCQ